MRLTAVLHGFLNRVWGKDPKAVPALTIAHSGPMSWQVQDDVLTLTVTGGLGTSQTFDLTEITLQELRALIDTQTGFGVVSWNPDLDSYGAVILLDGSGDQSAGLKAYTSLRWAILDAIARELQNAEAAAAAAPAQLSTTSASDEWLDQLGSYLGGTLRISGEGDPAYALRIPATVLQPKCNNVAIEAALESTFGIENASVTDVAVLGPAAPLFDGSIQFAGSHDYDAEPTISYGLYDIGGTYNGPLSGPALSQAIRALLDAFRAGGTHPRLINIAVPLLTLEGDYVLASDGSQITVSAV